MTWEVWGRGRRLVERPPGGGTRCVLKVGRAEREARPAPDGADGSMPLDVLALSHESQERVERKPNAENSCRRFCDLL